MENEREDPFAWFDDSPDAGDPACICSWCGRVIGAADGPLRIFNGEGSKKREARFHLQCADDAGIITIIGRAEVAAPTIEALMEVFYGSPN